MGVDTRSVHADNPGWRDMVSSCLHEWLSTFMIAVRTPCLARGLQKTYLPKGWGAGDGGAARLAWRRWGDKLIGLSIDLEELRSASRAIEARVDEALAGNQELQSYVQRL